MTKLRFWFICLAAMGSLACTLAGNPVTPTPVSTPTPIITGRPSVIIESPQEGDEVTVGDNVLVSATATDQGGITSVQLFANERLIKTVPSETIQGDQTLPVVLDYEAISEGDVLLEVIAYRGTVASDPAQVNVSVLGEEEDIVAPVNPGPSLPVIDPTDPTCRILTNVALNYRTGPSTDFSRLGTFTVGTQVPIVGRLGDNTWWQVQATAFTQAWVSAEFTTEYGICNNIPVVSSPPTPTTTPATATPIPTSTFTPEPSITPTLTPLPNPADLIVSNISGATELTLSGGTASTNYAVQITNTGDSPTGGQFDNTITILPGNTQLALGVIGNLNAGESIVLNRQVTFDAAGEFTLQAQADSNNDIEEITTVNNIGSLVITVNPES